MTISPLDRRLLARLVRRMDRRGTDPTRARNIRPIDYVIVARADYAAQLLPHVVDGKVGVVRTGMDCDCSAYSYASVALFTGVLTMWREQCEHESWLDGPESTTFCKPAEVPRTKGYSRDLALEAFEDGHPHSIHF